MPKVVSTGLKIVFLGACMLFIIWGLQEFLKSGSIYSLFGWCYLMLGIVAPSVVLLGHSERRKKGKYLSSHAQLKIEGAVLIGLIVFIIGLFAPIGFSIQLAMSLIGFLMAVPASFIYLYLSPPQSSTACKSK